MEMTLKAETLFLVHFSWWRFLGLLPTEKYRRSYIAYSIFMNVFITIGYPLHLIIGLFLTTTMYDVIKNTSVSLTCLVCSVKTFVILLKFENIYVMLDITKNQNRRIAEVKDNYYYYKYVVFKNVHQIFKVFVILYATGCSLIEISVLFNGFMGTWDLMFPGYFLFDPFKDTISYIVVHIYQCVGISFQILQNVTNDSFVAMQLALFSGQIHCLSMRVSKLGRDKSKTVTENNQELLECVEDHKELLR